MRMLDPRELYDLTDEFPGADPGTDRDTGADAGGLVLIQAMDGFVDAGGAGRLAREHLLSALESRVVATFDVDQLFDYRARRPAMVFVEDHWESYDTPSLAVHLVSDDTGRPFLVLAGPEPDVQWERFVVAVRQLIEAFGVRLTIGLNAIPMGLPHTRPVGVIAHSADKELVKGYQAWIGTVQVPASAGHLLEFRLGEAGQQSMGFAAHVPHYVAQSEYPAAAAALLREVSAASGLVLPTQALVEAAERTREMIDAQVADSEEVAAVVQALEAQYDAFVASTGRSLPGQSPSHQSPLDQSPIGRAPMTESDMPSGDELGAELERYLAEQNRRADPPA